MKNTHVMPCLIIWHINVLGPNLSSSLKVEWDHYVSLLKGNVSYFTLQCFYPDLAYTLNIKMYNGVSV